MLQTIWNLTPEITSQAIFTIILLSIVLGWILVALWTRAIENFVFGTLYFNENSSWHAFLIAFSVTLIFIGFVWMIDTYKIIPGGIEEKIENGESIKNITNIEFSDDVLIRKLNNDIRSNQLDHFSRNENGNILSMF